MTTQHQPSIVSLDKLTLRTLKRTRELFLHNPLTPPPEDRESKKVKISAKIYGEYKNVEPQTIGRRPPTRPEKSLNVPSEKQTATNEDPNNKKKILLLGSQETLEVKGSHRFPTEQGVELDENAGEGGNDPVLEDEQFQQILEDLPIAQQQKAVVSHGLVEYKSQAGIAERLMPPGALRRPPTRFHKPKWHAPWKLHLVVVGHLGWVRSIGVDPSNEWFATGSADRTVKIWDLATGDLKVTLTGHINAIRGIQVSKTHPYIFTVGEDKMVKCWDLEYNKVIRHYHGHLSGVFSVAMHPTISVLITGGRDSTARVWDIRTKAQIHCLTGHTSTVWSVDTQATDPQVITGSADKTVRLWDLSTGKTMATLTNHKKSVRSVLIHPDEFSFASASADNIKKWKFPHGNFISNLSGHKAIINTLALNPDNVLVSGSDDGTMHFWDWKSGYNFQREETKVQPGSLESEAGIFCAKFDVTGTRLITAEADKTVKIWKEDERATPDSHPITWRPNRSASKF